MARACWCSPRPGELAVQVTDACKGYGKNLRHAKAVSVVGGMPYPVQNKLLSSPYEILVATPGRLMDQMNSGRIDFARLEILILDEADRMLDMGFVDDIEAIVAKLPANRQTLFFSATLDGQVARMMQRLLKDPERIEIASAQTRHENIEQRLLVADDIGHKTRLLDGLLRDVGVDQAIVFTATKRDADALTLNLESQGHSVAALHGDMNQRMRTPHPRPAASRPRARADRHRRRRPRHRRAQHQPRDQLRPAQGCRRLRAPHRPHRPRRLQRHRHQPGRAPRRAPAARHRALHPASPWPCTPCPASSRAAACPPTSAAPAARVATAATSATAAATSATAHRPAATVAAAAAASTRAAPQLRRRRGPPPPKAARPARGPAAQ